MLCGIFQDEFEFHALALNTTNLFKVHSFLIAFLLMFKSQLLSNGESLSFLVWKIVKQSCLSSETFVLFVCSGIRMTYYLKPSFDMPSCTILKFKKKNVSQSKVNLRGNHFRKLRIQQKYKFIFYVVEKSFNLLWSVTLIWSERCSREA